MPRVTSFATAMASQPSGLIGIAAAIETALAGQAVPRWNAGDSVAIVAMGASLHSAHALVHTLIGYGIRAVAVNAAELADAPRGFAIADHLVVVSESGRSPEPIAAVRDAAAHRIAITDEPTSPLAQVCDLVLPLGGIADSKVYTLGFTGTLLAYSILARATTGRGTPIDVDALSHGVAEQLAGSADRAVDLLWGVHSIDVVGSGRSRSAAAESALMLREGVSVPTSAFETYQYLHGPMESLGSDSGVLVFGSGREHALIADALRVGARVVHITSSGSDDPRFESDRLLRWEIPASTDAFAQAIHETVAAQTIVAALAGRAHRDIGEFRLAQPDTKLP